MCDLGRTSFSHMMSKKRNKCIGSLVKSTGIMCNCLSDCIPAFKFVFFLWTDIELTVIQL